MAGVALEADGTLLGVPHSGSGVLAPATVDEQVGWSSDRMVESRSPDASLTFDVVTSRSAFDALEREWNDLFARAGRGEHVFQTFNWCWHWSRHYLDGRRKLAIVTGRCDGRLVLVWPLVTERFAGLTQLVWMGGPVAQYGDVLIDPAIDAGAALGAAHRHLLAGVRADLMRLRLVRDDAVVATFLAGQAARVTQRYEAPYLDLASAPAFAAYEARYPAKARKNRRRLLRRLGERAPAAFRDLPPGPEAGAMAEEAVLLKRRWLTSRNLVSKALASDRMIAFLADAAADRERPVGCQVSVLTVGDDVASIQVGFRCRERLVLHVIVFDLAFEKAGAGVLHLEQRIARSFDEGVGVLDLLAPRADYKMDWADGTAPVADHALAMTLKGRLFIEAYLMRLRSRLKALAPHLPSRLRRMASSA